jgi:hypothetical protein
MVDEYVRGLLDKVGGMVGGKWVSEQKNEDGSPKIEWVYEWSPCKRVVKGTGSIFGVSCESRIGWDPVEEKIYYLDMHGPETVYFGYMTEEDNEFVFDFESIVGPFGVYRSRGCFLNENSYRSRIQSVEDGIAIDKNEVRLVRI